MALSVLATRVPETQPRTTLGWSYYGHRLLLVIAAYQEIREWLIAHISDLFKAGSGVPCI